MTFRYSCNPPKLWPVAALCRAPPCRCHAPWNRNRSEVFVGFLGVWEVDDSKVPKKNGISSFGWKYKVAKLFLLKVV